MKNQNVMPAQEMAAADPHAGMRGRHLDAHRVMVRALAGVDFALCFVVPTAKVAALWALLWFAHAVFGLRVHRPGLVMAVAVVLWFWWAMRRAGAEPLLSTFERHRRAMRAREADERGHCMNRQCKLCGGKPAPRGEAS